MKKLFKIMIALVLMLTFTFTITACNDDSAGADGTNSKELTVADIFNNIEYIVVATGKTKKVSYEELSGSTTLDESKSSGIKIKAYASHKFEITKITAKYQSLYDNHTSSDGYTYAIYNTTSFKDANRIVRKEVDFENTSNYNKQHTIEITFKSGELVIEKNKGVGMWLSSSGETGTTYWTNIEIYGNVIEE